MHFDNLHTSMKKSQLAALLLFTGLCTLGSLSAQTINFNYTGGVVTYTIPTTGTYTLTGAGAQGGFGVGAFGGKGAYVSGSIQLTSGTVLNIAVGGRGGDALAFSGGGGGGGTFVYTTTGGLTPLLVAGGGGGAGLGRAGSAGQATPNGTDGSGPIAGSGGTGGQGGIGLGLGSGGGAGFQNPGGVGARGGEGAPNFSGGSSAGGGGVGGFGGGGAGSGFGPSGGGGGGYSGGGSGGNLGGGGGGGSYLDAAFFNSTLTAGANALAGYFTLLFTGGGSSGLIAFPSVTVAGSTATYSSVTFLPNGILNITPTGNLTITSSVNVTNNGTVTLNGVFNTPNLTLTPGSFLNGSGILNGNLINNGTLSPGNSPGTLTINGNFTQGSTGTLNIEIASASSFDQLIVNGSVLLGGTLNIIPYNGYILQFGQKFGFITSTGPIKGAFSSILAPAGYRARVSIVGDPVAYITIAPASYTQLALNRNQSNVATALNSFIPATSGDQLVVSSALDSLSASQYSQAFNAIMPTFYQSLSTIAFNLANAQNSELVQRLWGLRVAQGGGFSMSGLPDNTPVIEGQGDKGVLDAKKDILRPGEYNHWGLFVDGNGIFAQANSANMLPGYKSQSGGITTGLTYKWNDSFGTGLYAGYEGTYAKLGAAGSGLGVGSQLIDNSVRFGLFGTYGQPDGKGFYADALAGGGYNNYQATRIIQFSGLNRTATSSPGAGELDTMLAGGYDIKKGLFTFGPTASLQYTYLGVNPVNETGAQSLNFSSGGWNSSSMLSSVGAHAAYTWQAGRNVVVVPQISLNWQHEFMQNPYAISGTLGGSSPNFSNWSSAPIRDTLYTGVGFTVEFAKKWNTAFFYNASAGNANLVSQNIFWSAGMKF